MQFLTVARLFTTYFVQIRIKLTYLVRECRPFIFDLGDKLVGQVMHHLQDLLY